MNQLYEIILQSANSTLSLLNTKTGSMPAGHNGSYYDPETPVRNTSHWLITFLKAYEISADNKFLEAARKNIEYLLSSEARPMKATFWHRKNPKKDSCNGLIGQAWTIEALVTAGVQLEMPELIKLAEEVFLLHPFDQKIGLWQCVSVDGTYLDFDYTFNHQLWFAAAGGLLASQTKGEVESKISYFMEQLEQNFEIHSSGLIRHFVALKLFPWRIKFYRKITEPLFNNLKRIEKLAKSRHYLKQKEIGYHSFNLYAFGLLKQQYPDNSFWNSSKFKKALNYVQTQQYRHNVRDSKYGYPYNPPGIETAFALEVFDRDRTIEQEEWLFEQFERSYDFEQHMMNKNTEDPATYAARVYEATRLPNLKIETT